MHDIVIVPFPFLEKTGQKFRPAVVCGQAATDNHPLYWLSMITGQTASPWQEDILLQPSPHNGLQKPSLLRTAKITAVPETLIVQKLGRLQRAEIRQLETGIHKILRGG